MEEALAFYRAHRERRMEGGARICLAQIALRACETDRAATEAAAARTLMREWPPLLPLALALCAEVRRRQGRLAEARGLAGEARALMGRAAETGEGFVRLVEAEVLHLCGDHEAARAALRLAAERLHARAAAIEPLAWRKSFLETVPEHARTLALAAEWGVLPRPD